MHPRVAFALLLGLAAVAATACGGKATSESATTDASAVGWPYTSPRIEYGFIRSLTPLGQGYKLRLDLHLLFGPDKTGLAACVDSHECPPGQTGFLDDTYDHDLRYVVTYYVPPNVPVALVGFSGRSPKVTARYFYGLTRGRNPRRVQVMAPGNNALREFGFYVEVAAPYSPHRGYELVRRLSQQYHP